MYILETIHAMDKLLELEKLKWQEKKAQQAKEELLAEMCLNGEILSHQELFGDLDAASRERERAFKEMEDKLRVPCDELERIEKRREEIFNGE